MVRLANERVLGSGCVQCILLRLNVCRVEVMMLLVPYAVSCGLESISAG